MSMAKVSFLTVGSGAWSRLARYSKVLSLNCCRAEAQDVKPPHVLPPQSLQTLSHAQWPYRTRNYDGVNTTPRFHGLTLRVRITNFAIGSLQM